MIISQPLPQFMKGFNPPSPGAKDSKEEKSINYEAGFRYNKDSLKN